MLRYLGVRGRNLLALSGLTMLRGFHAAVPFSRGASAGATTLAWLPLEAIVTVFRAGWQFGQEVSELCCWFWLYCVSCGRQDSMSLATHWVDP